MQLYASLPQELFCSSLDGLQIGQVELQKDRFIPSALLELSNGGLTLNLVTASNVDFHVLYEKDLSIDASVQSKSNSTASMKYGL